MPGVAGQHRPAGADPFLGLDAMVDQQLGDEFPVFRRDSVGQLAVGQVLALALEFRRDDDVRTVGPAADVIVDPGEFPVELLGGVRRRAQHAETAGVGDGGDNVAAMAEGEERKVDAELFADAGSHPVSFATPT